MEANLLDFVYAADSEARARDIHLALHEESKGSDEVSTFGEWKYLSHWEPFHWGVLRESQVRPFRGTDEPERWTVPDLPHVEIRYEPQPFYDAGSPSDPAAQEAARDIVDLVRLAYSATSEPPRFVYGVTDLHKELLGNDLPLPVTAESLAANEIEYATWLMVFPPAMVETYGRDQLLSAPAWHTEELDDGAVLIVSTAAPIGDGETEAIDEHLGIDRPPAADEHTY